MNINSFEKLKEVMQQQARFFLLLYKSGSEQSDCAFERIQKVWKESISDIYFADVSSVRDIHEKLNITSAPSLIEFSNGKIKNILKGCQTESFYKTTLTGENFTKAVHGQKLHAKRVTVYTTPTCSWCTTLKTYLKEKKITYTEIDVVSNQSKAEEMVKKSGQQGVPQTEINGQMIIGFDKNRINQLLELK